MPRIRSCTLHLFLITLALLAAGPTIATENTVLVELFGSPT